MKYAFGNNKSAVNAPINPAFRKMTSKYRDDVNKTAFVLNSYQDYLDAVKEFKVMVVGTWGGKGQLALMEIPVPKESVKNLLSISYWTIYI